MEDNYSKLYKAMVNSGYDTADLGGSEDDFRREMQDSTTRKNFYDWVSNNEMNGFRIGSYDAYEERLAPTQTVTAPQVETEPLGKAYAQAADVVKAVPQLGADKSAYTFTAEELGIEEPEKAVEPTEDSKKRIMAYSSIDKSINPFILPSENHDVVKDPYLREAMSARKQIADKEKYIHTLGNAATEADREELQRLKEAERAAIYNSEHAVGVDANPFGQVVGAVTYPIYKLVEGVGDVLGNKGINKFGKQSAERAVALMENRTINGRPALENEWLDLRNNALYKNGKDGDLTILGTVLQSTEELAAGLTDPVYRAADWIGEKTGASLLEEIGEAGRANIDEIYENSQYKDNSFFGKFAQLVPQLAGTAASLLTGNPVLAKASMGAMVGSSMGSAAREAEKEGASLLEQFAAAGLNGVIELGTEKFSLGHWLGKIATKVGTQTLKKAGEEVVEAEAEALFKEAKKELGGKITAKTVKEFAKDLVVEGGSEATAEFFQTLVPIIYRDKDKWPTWHEAFQNAWDGAIGGLMMAGTLHGVGSYAQRKANDKRWQEQGFIDAAIVNIKDKKGKDNLVVAEVVGEDENGNISILSDNKIVKVSKEDIKTRQQFEYNDFKSNVMSIYRSEGYSQNPELINGNTIALAGRAVNDAKAEVRAALSLNDDVDVDAMIADKEFQGDAKMAVDKYLAEKARYEGMQDRLNEERDSEIAEAEKEVDAVMHEDGNVYMTTLPSTGEAIFITGGKVVLDEEGYIDVNQSESLVALMPNGKKEAVQPGNVREKVSVENAEAQKAAKSAEIDARYNNQLNTFVYSDGMGDHTVQLIGRRGNLVDVIVDGRQMEMGAQEYDNIMAKVTGNGKVEGENEVQPVVAPVVEDQKGEKAEKVVEPVSEVAAPVVAAPKTALEQIPRNEKNVPLYEQVDSELAWDGVVEEAGGNEETAMVAVNSMVEDKKKALAAAEKAKAKAGVTITEKIAAENERVANIERAKADLAKWEEIAGVKAKRAETASAPVEDNTPQSQSDSSPTLVEQPAPQATNEMRPVSEEVVEPVEESQTSGQVAEGGNAPGQSIVMEIQQVLENGDKRITNYNSRGEVATVVTERDGKVVSVDSYDEGVLFEHTEYDENGSATWVTRYDKQGNVIGTQKYVDGKAKASHPVADKVFETAKKKQQARFAEHAKAIAEKLGVEVTVHNDASTVAGRDVMTAITNGDVVRGWYNPNTGEIALFLPAMESMRDVESTILHEAVAHYGIKHLLKEDWTKFLDGVWDMMPTALRAHFLQYVGADMKNPSQEKMRQAADEYVAHIAEKMDLDKVEKSIWNKLIDAVFNALRKVGFKNLTRGDIETVIRASYKNLRQNGGNSQVPGQGETMASKKGGKNKSSLNSAAPGKPVNATAKLDELFAKIDKLKQTYNSRTSKKTRGFITDIARELDLTKDESSHYRTFPTELGDITLRVSNHNSKLKEFEDRHEDEGVSIIISAKKNKKIDRRDSTGKSHVDEFFYPKQSLERSQGRPLVQILESIEDFLTTGVYVDKTGIAQPEDSRGIRFRKVFHGSGAKFDKFDHSHMGEGEGAQAFGWGTYVTEVEGIGKQYAKATSKPNFTYKGQEVDVEGFENPWRIIQDLYNEHRGKLRDMRKAADYYSDLAVFNDAKTKDLWQNVVNTLADIRAGDLKMTPSRVLYTVEIPDDNGSNYLHWEEVVPSNVVNAVKQRLFDELAKGDYKGVEKELKRELDDVFKYSDNEGYSLYGNISAYLGGGKAASRFLNEMGFVGISYPADGGRAGNKRNYVIFNENDAVIEDRIMFRRANKNQEVFVSNAQRAVEGIKQEKATPEQWIAMLKKNGGLKAGEEAWLGLEEWLNEKQGAVAKQEILNFIGENKIQIEEVEYGSQQYPQLEEMANTLNEEYNTLIADGMTPDEAWYSMEEKYDRINDAFYMHNFSSIVDVDAALDMYYDRYGVNLEEEGRAINSTRLDYTTEGLENKREIALTVPTVEPYNESDEVHFGDAGNGRAVAWVRFGETTADTDETIAAQKAVNDYLAEMREKYNTLEGEETDAMTAEEIKHLQELTAKEMESGEKKARVLVIDEIQSKRHQDGREKGYATEDYIYAKRERDYLYKKMYEKGLTEEEHERYKWLQQYTADNFGVVPSAPFEKNWHELAMKRMLRLAAEEGFDKVAWTTGEQQAQRYNLGKAFNDIEREDNPNIDGRRFVLNGANVETFQVDENGNIVDSTLAEAKGKPLADVVGKDMAVKMMSLENGDMLEGEDLHIGGEGMKGFYDRMLPSFVSKYTKKWGAKVGEVTMPNLSENNTMHSVDVTPEMKESVMEGQTMFSKKITYDEAVQIGNDFAKTHKGAAKKMVFSRGAAEVEQQMRDAGFTDLSIEVVLDNYKSGDLPTQSYLRSSDAIVFYEYPTDIEVYASLWHENGHRAMRMIYGDDLSEVERVFNTLPEDIRNEKIEELKERGYTKEEFPKEAVCYFIQDAYAIGALDDARVDLTDFGKAYPDMKDFANFAQQIINYTRHGERNEDFISKVEGEFPQGKINTRLQEWDTERREEGAGVDETATSGLTEEEVTEQEGETLFSKKELTPEQKKKQEALKENAKAIRRLHNVKANYPITALRNLGFALETQEQRNEHDRLFAERDAITGESMPAGLQTNPQTMTLLERITESLLKQAEQEKENVEMRLSAIRAYGRDLANVIKLMNAQKGYDRNTVRMFTDLVKMYLRNNAMDGLSSYEIARLLNLMQRATGGREKMVNQVAVKIAEIITGAHTKQLNGIMEKQIKTGREKVNASGVVVQGGVDIIGKRVLNTYRDAIAVATEEDFKKRYDAAFARVGDLQKSIENAKQAGKDTKALENLLKEAQADADAMLLAANYRNEIKVVEEDIETLKSELSGKRDALAKGEITRGEYYESAKSINSQIVQMRAKEIDAYQRVLHALSGDIYEGVQRARAFREAEAMRVQKIHDMAENDMGGVTKSAERKEPGVAGKTVDMMVYKNPVTRAVMHGLGTYENYMKYFGRDHLDGRGELFEYFMTAFNEAQDKEWKEQQNDFNILEAVAQKIFGNKGIVKIGKKKIGKTYKTIARDSTKGSGVILKYWDGGAMVERELTIGQLMYLYMTEKQAEGQMKLRNMGLTEEKVQNAVAKLPAKYKAFADYIQTSFLPEMRPRMNEVHQRMFGASMSEVENYFPLKVNQDARKGDTDLNNTGDVIPSTITGAVIKRRVNVTPIDLTANAFDVLNEHIVDMEHWAAYAEFTRDNNTLINDNDFKNRVKNTKSVRHGDGEKIWEDFVETARITTGNYQQRRDYIAKLMSGANAAKITFGYYTALKQLSSLPAFLADANAIDLVWNTAKAYGSWQWAKKNLPGFEERWKGRTGGNERLGENEYSIHDSRIMKFARMAGMTPNAFIDAAVVAAGARAVYETRLRFYKSLGLTNYEADKRAKNDAAISYNETQQSGQGAYLSRLQKEGGIAALLTTLFRNSQMAFQRRVVGSLVNTGKKLARGERIREATKRKYMQMGMDEAAAEKRATKEFYKSYAKDITNLAIFGYGMNFLWVLMGQLPYLLFGDDDEEKEKIFDQAKKVGVTGMFEGFTLGNVAKAYYENKVNGTDYAVSLLEAPFEQDLDMVLSRFEKDGTMAGILQLGIFLTEMNTGISPQRLIDDAVAVIDFCDGDVELANDGVLFALRMLKAPQSQQDMLILDELEGADAERVKKVAEKFIEYKMTRNFPFGSEDEKRVDKYANKFVETLKERVEKDYDPEDISVIYDRSSDTEKEILKKKWVEEMDKRNGTNAAKSLRKEKIEELLGSPVEKAAAKALHRFTKTNPYEKMETFDDLERWYEYDVLLDVFKKDYQRIRDEEEMTPEERAKAVEHYGVYADKGFKEVINAIKAHKKLIKENNDPEWRMGEIRRLTDIATEIMKRYE